MASAAATTMIKMMEMLPVELQDRALEHMREYLEDIREESRWDESFSRTQDKLVEVARQARKEIHEGKATPFDSRRL